MTNSKQILSPYLLTFKEPRNRFRQAGNRFLGSLKGLQIRVQDYVHILVMPTLCGAGGREDRSEA
jgi:hypothetical protein